MALGNAISDAHLRTCLYSNEHIDVLKQRPVLPEVVNTYKGMVGGKDDVIMCAFL